MRKRLFLTGFMGAGKSTLGRKLADALGWTFVDVDALIESREGRTVAALFEAGEETFRAAEYQAIESLAGREHLVVALGGGAFVQPETRGLIRSLGPIVWLDAPLETLWARAGRDKCRPLAADRARFEALYAERRAIYATLPLRIDTAAQAPEQAVQAIRQALEVPEETVMVALGDRSYPIRIAPGSLGAIAAYLDLPPSPCLIVTDEQVGARYAEPVLASLARAGWTPTLVTIPAGETSKSFEQAQRLFDACVEANLLRRHPVIALGGGVVGDLAGFVAATYMRGMPFVQVPTSLLAQVDSSVGGKVAINHPGGKNLIGAFYQPRLVLIDPLTLLSLSEREYRAGLAETAKYGVIHDPEMFAEMEAEAEAIARRDLRVLGRLVARACAIKAEVVGEDEREEAGGRRVILNFGHTIGHAIEAVAGYGEWLHGEAVAIGMIVESAIAVQRRLWSDGEHQRLARLLSALGLPVTLPALDTEALVAAMGRDKKNLDAGITFVLPRAFGTVETFSIAPDEVRMALLGALAPHRPDGHFPCEGDGGLAASV